MDFAHYRTILKNQAVIDEVEKKFSDFRPATYDVSRQLKAIDAFRAQAVQSAEETKASVDKELGDLRTALKNIEETRPLEDLTVVRASQPVVLVGDYCPLCIADLPLFYSPAGGFLQSRSRAGAAGGELRETGHLGCAGLQCQYQKGRPTLARSCLSTFR